MLQLVCLLVDHGADINQKNKRGKTPQDVAGVDLTKYLRSWNSSGIYFLVLMCLLCRVSCLSVGFCSVVLVDDSCFHAKSEVRKPVN